MSEETPTKPNEKAIAKAESLLRKLRTGEMTGFVAVATDTEDVSSYTMGGRVNFTQTVCLLEHLRMLCLLSQWAKEKTNEAAQRKIPM